LGDTENIRLIEPVDARDLHNAISGVFGHDGFGRLQEEAPSLASGAGASERNGAPQAVRRAQ
jgi:hypothetical protein